jgi:chitodextrinase
LSGYSNTATATPTATPPTAPTNLADNVISSSQINLTWTASTSGAAGYVIQRCQGASCSNFAQIASVGGTVTTYGNTGLTASTSYSYRVQATDANGNLSAYSNIVTATTAAAGDTQPPSNPTNLTATAGPMDTVLSWTASTDNVGVTGYFIERCEGVSCTSFAQVATVDASYSYRVRATDAAGNLSGYSNSTSDSPLDCD